MHRQLPTGKFAIHRIVPITQLLHGTDAQDGRIRRILVDSLYSQPFSLLIGHAIGIVTAIIAAASSDMTFVWVLATLLSVVALARSVLCFVLPRMSGTNAIVLERIFELGAFSYAALYGALCATCIGANLAPEVQLLVTGNVLAYAASAPARNSGRPVIAIGQMLLVAVPTSTVLALRPDMASRALAVCVMLLLPGVISVVSQVYALLRRSFDAAENSARLATRMQELARTDVVTGLLNRAGLNHELAHQAEALQPGEHLALLWFDLDRFKGLNDIFGHQTGDRVLAETGQRLASITPPDAVVARFGGDEFIVAYPVRGRAEACQMAATLLDAVQAPMRLEDGSGEWMSADDIRVQVGASIGIALMPEDGADAETLMRHADMALYSAKEEGRGQAVTYDPAMARELARSRAIDDDLRQALQRDELSVFFQPIIDLSTGRIRSFEALVRWFHAERGELTPDQFIPVAEENGAIIPLGNWITATAARAAASWPADVTLSVNLSPAQIKTPGAATRILATLAEAGLPPERLELEITETVLLEHNEPTDTFIRDLSQAGVRFALDDFGTGYSSLSSLSKYAFNRIKVDRSFVSGPNAGRRSDAIIRAVSGMATQLDIEIVAEGIETEEQARAMIAAGCTLGQGYYFSRAVPQRAVAMLLERAPSPHAFLRMAS